MVTFHNPRKEFCIAIYLNNVCSSSYIGKVERLISNYMVKSSNPHRALINFLLRLIFPLQGKDKFPLDEGDIFESKFPHVDRIGLAARACGSGIGPSLSNRQCTVLHLR